LCLFDSHRQLESYIADNIDAFHVWPGVTQYASREYLYYYCLNELFSDYFHKHGLLPRLSSRPAAMHWATEFINRHSCGAVPVTVQLRKNAVNSARNSDYESWLAFFQRCAGTYAAKFIVICSHAEIDPRFRALPNVIIAKELGTALEQDLALIEIAAIHMGASSGPGTIAQFNDKPYCIFNPTMSDGYVKSFKLQGDRGTFIFSSPHQYWIHGKETPDILLREFDMMWEAVKGNHAHSNQEKLLIDR